MSYYVYAYYSELDYPNPLYIGKGKGKRMFDHLKYSYMIKNDRFHRKLHSLKSKNVEVWVKIIKSNITEQEAFNLEIKLIAQYGRRDIKTGILYNHSDGGEGQSGRIVSNKTRENLRKSHLGYTHSQETIIKMIESSTGRKHSAESRIKMIKSQSYKAQPIESFNLITGETIKKYDSINQAYREDGFYSTNICGALRGKYSYMYGMGWRYSIEITESKPIDPDSFANKPFEE